MPDMLSRAPSPPLLQIYTLCHSRPKSPPRRAATPAWTRTREIHTLRREIEGAFWASRARTRRAGRAAERRPPGAVPGAVLPSKKDTSPSADLPLYEQDLMRTACLYGRDHAWPASSHWPSSPRGPSRRCRRGRASSRRTARPNGRRRKADGRSWKVVEGRGRAVAGQWKAAEGRRGPRRSSGKSPITARQRAQNGATNALSERAALVAPF